MFRPPLLVSVLALGATALAQTPPRSAAPPLPPPPSIRTAAIPPAATTPGAEELVTMLFPGSDVKEVLGLYEKITQKRLVYDNSVVGPMNIVLSSPVPRDEAIRIIEINLLLNGFTLVPAEGTNIVKVIGTGRNPRTAAIPIVADELQIPEGEHVITYLAKLQYADPTELVALLGTYIVQSPGQFTNVTALPKSQAVLITENTATIRGLLRIIREIDIPPAEVVAEFLTLERADAKDILEKLTTIFQKQPTGGAGAAPAAARPGIPRPPQTTPDGTPIPQGATAEVTSPNSVEIRAGTLNEDSIIAGKIVLTADVRTNRIHVVTRPINMPFVRKLVKEFDQNVKFGEPTRRELRFVTATDVLPVVVKAISEPGAKDDAGGNALSGRQGSATRNTGSGAGAGGGSMFGNNQNNGSGFGGGGSSTLGASALLSTESVDTAPEAVTVGNTKIIADNRANAIIVLGNQEVKAKIFRVLDELDRRAPMVTINTIIGELNLNGKEQFGVDVILRNAGLGASQIITPGTGGTGTGTGTGGTGTGDGTATGSTPTVTTGNLATFNGSTPAINFNNLLNQDAVRAIGVIGGSGLSGYFAAGNTLSAAVTALENSNRFRVTSRPSVTTSNNKKAKIASGQQVAVPTSIQSSINSTNQLSSGIVSNSNVQFKDVTLELEVVPLINSEREVALEIVQKVDEISGSTRIDNNDIPTIATRYIQTNVSVPNGGTVVLGGLIKQSDNRTRSGLPYLSRLPVLGPLFSSRSKEKIRTELVILLRPEVIWGPVEAIRSRERANEFLNIEPDLEATIYPAGSRTNYPPENMLRGSSVEVRKTVEVIPKFKK